MSGKSSSELLQSMAELPFDELRQLQLSLEALIKERREQGVKSLAAKLEAMAASEFGVTGPEVVKALRKRRRQSRGAEDQGAQDKGGTSMKVI